MLLKQRCVPACLLTVLAMLLCFYVQAGVLPRLVGVGFSFACQAHAKVVVSEIVVPKRTRAGNRIDARHPYIRPSSWLSYCLGLALSIGPSFFGQGRNDFIQQLKGCALQAYGLWAVAR